MQQFSTTIILKTKTKMKKIIFIIITFCLFGRAAKACDICGCGVGSNYIGILPDFTKRIMGLRYRYNSMTTHIGSDNTQTYLTSEEKYRIAELWGGWNIGKRFRVMVSVPYNFDQRTKEGLTGAKKGIGDISINGFYQLVNSRKMINNKLFVQSLFVGAGIKLPTGKYNSFDKENSNETANLFQLGTASTDFNINAMYDIRLQDIGINVNASYKINTVNKYEYVYGNKLSINTQLYYKFRVNKNFVIAPNTGIQIECSEKDVERMYKVDASGGNIISTGLGVETRYKRIAVGANWQTPLSQNLANGFVKANNRGMMHVSFFL